MKHSPAFLALVQDSMKRVREVSVEDVRRRVEAGERFHFIDVREDGEWDKGRCRGAKHMGRGILERDVEAAFPEKAAELVLYCGGGFRSALAADNLQKMGYVNVKSMAGGWRAWVEAGGPVEP